MKKRVRNVLNTRGSGLKYSHVGEMLTDGQKVKVLKSSHASEILLNKEQAKVVVHHT